MSSLSTSLKNSYQKWLQPYEEYLRVAKPGVQQQIELENGGPFTPSPANSPLKAMKPNRTPNSIGPDSPANRASTALNASIADGNNSERETPIVDAPRPVASGFTPVNTGGFTPVNAGSAFTPVNPMNGIKREGANSMKSTPEFRPLGAAPAPLSNGHLSNNLKRRLSHDSFDRGSPAAKDSTPNGDLENGERRSKRLKKGKSAPAVPLFSFFVTYLVGRDLVECSQSV